jgi:hypothetical protein
MLTLTKTLTELDGRIVKMIVKVESDGTIFLYCGKMKKRYERLDVCLVENNFHEFLSKEYDYDEHRD